jgi:hypothetical protein
MRHCADMLSGNRTPTAMGTSTSGWRRGANLSTGEGFPAILFFGLPRQHKQKRACCSNGSGSRRKGRIG